MQKKINITRNLLESDLKYANKIRSLLTERHIYMCNLIGSPGSGKTTLLEATLEKIKQEIRVAVIEGDVATSLDAERISRHGTPVIQINTQGGCHLEARLLHKAMNSLPMDSLDMIFVENVGNLVCPAEFDLGEHHKIAVCSVAEGDEKPAKYPMLFANSRAVVLTKKDLMQYTNFNRETFWKNVGNLNGASKSFEIDSIRADGIENWISFLEDELWRVKND